MATPQDEQPARGRKVRVPFRRNRSTRRRNKDWTQKAQEADGQDLEGARTESVVAKGDLSRRRTIIVRDGGAPQAGTRHGTVIAVRGLFAEVDDGQRIWTCTVRRILRTRQIGGRMPIAAGDHVDFIVETSGDAQSQEGTIESVAPRRGELLRLAGRRVHTIAANVDQAIIVSSAAEPLPKPHLIDRYIVSAHAGGITPVICMNKIDLDPEGAAAGILERYANLGYQVLRTSAATGEGIDALRGALRDKSSVIAGQSGVGKSSLLNVVQPGLELRVAQVSEQTNKGKHTTTTASLIRLEMGGYVVDTPGVRSFDVSIIPRNEFEAYFVEFVPLVPNCRFPDCTHTHESDCAIKAALERGEIHPDRYATYVELFAGEG